MAADDRYQLVIGKGHAEAEYRLRYLALDVARKTRNDIGGRLGVIAQGIRQFLAHLHYLVLCQGDKRLHGEGTPLALIEPDADAVERARALGIPALVGNAASVDKLGAVHVADARAIVVAIPQTLEAGQIIRHAREANPAIAVLARAHSDEEVAYLLGCGADAAVMGEREIARSMCESVDGLARWFRRPDAEAAPDAA